MDCKMGIKVER